MANFVLVHGGFDGGWVWRKVARLLRAEGHEVLTPTLTGLGERSHLGHAGVNLETHIRDVVNAIVWEDLDRVVLCGHSLGGTVVAGVADAVPERIAALVYLDALIPGDGQSAFDLMDPARLPDRIRAAGGAGGLAIPAPATSPAADPADAAWVVRHMTAHPLGYLTQAIRLTGALERVSRVYAVYAAGFGFAARFADAARARAGWDVRVVADGHMLQVDQPSLVAAVLREAAG